MSILPKIDVPMFDEKIPSTKQKIKMRPMVSKEEKILLMAKESSDIAATFTAIKQVVNNCIMEESFDINKLFAFDVEYLFLKLRCASISDKVIISIIDSEDEQEYNVGIDLSRVEVKFPEEFEKIISIDKKIKIEMKYLSAQYYDDAEMVKEDNINNFIDMLLLRSIDKIYNGESVIDVKNVTREEMIKWLDELPISVKDKMKDFIDTSPSLYYKAEYKNSTGKDRYLELRNLNDFFTL